MSFHHFSTAVQTKKKQAKSNKNSISEEEMQKINRRQVQMELRKERRSLQIERNRHLTALDYSSFDVIEDDNVSIETIAGELKNQHDLRVSMGCGDVVDCSVSRSVNNDENVAHCLHLIQNKLRQENNGSISPPIPEINHSLNSSVVEYIVHNQQCSTFQIFVSLLNHEIADDYSSNKHLSMEIVDTIYLITKMANSEQLQIMAKTFIHQPLLSILHMQADIVLCTKAFFCLSFIASNCKDLRIFLIENGYALIVLKHSQNALNLSKSNEENIVNYARSIAYSTRIFTRDFGDKFVTDVLQSLNNLMQLNDDLVVANVYWSLSELSVSGLSSNIDYIQKSNIVLKLIEVLVPHEQRCISEQVKEAAIACLANITACSGLVADTVIICNFVRLGVIESLIQSNSSVMQYQTVVTITNLVNANPSIIRELTTGGIIGTILDLLYLGEYKSQKQVTILLRNIVLKGSPEDAIELLNRDMISSLSTQLTVTEPDLILTTLEIYEHLLEMEKKRYILFDVALKCDQLGVIDKMESLVSHPNQVITDKCYRIYDNYIATQDMNTVDSEQTNTFSF